MFGYIYLTENKINHKKYIGQHRSTKYDPKYLGSGVILKQAIDKYGKENFTNKIIKECWSEEELNQQEIYFISKYNAAESDDYYNVTTGGLGHSCDPWNKGKQGVQEVTEKMLEALRAGQHLPASEKLKAKLRDRNNLVIYTDEYRNKLSVASKEYFKNHQHKYLYSPTGKRTRIELKDLDEYISKGYKTYTEYKLESSTTNS